MLPTITYSTAFTTKIPNKFDEEIDKNYKCKNADKTKLNAAYTLIINTCVKIKIPN